MESVNHQQWEANTINDQMSQAFKKIIDDCLDSEQFIFTKETAQPASQPAESKKMSITKKIVISGIIVTVAVGIGIGIYQLIR